MAGPRRSPVSTVECTFFEEGVALEAASLAAAAELEHPSPGLPLSPAGRLARLGQWLRRGWAWALTVRRA